MKCSSGTQGTFKFEEDQIKVLQQIRDNVDKLA